MLIILYRYWRIYLEFKAENGKMNKISKLLQITDLFYKKAAFQYRLTKAAQTGGYYMPDEEEDEGSEEESVSNKNSNLPLYDRIIEESNRLRDRDLSQELQLIGEMYKKAVELGAGYSTINNGISNLLNMYMDDEDNPEYEDVEALLNEIVKDLRARAGGPGGLNKPDKPEVMQQLRAIKQEFNRRMAQETMEQLESGDLTSEEVGGLTQFEEDAKGKFDFSGGVNPEEAQKGKGRGYSIQSRSLKDWIKAYESEKEKYEDLLLDTSNPLRKEQAKKLVDILNKLIQATTKQMEVASDHSAAPTPESEAQLKEINQQISAIKKERRALKLAIRDTELEKTFNSLKEELASSTDMREKFLIQQQMELNKLLRSKDLNRGAETKLRRTLIRGMSGGSTLGAETLKKLMQQIQEAASRKKPIEEYRKEIADKIREKKQKGDFEGLVIKLKQHVPTVKSEEKKAILKRELDRLIKAASEQEQTTYKPYLDAIAAAHRAKDKAAIKSATAALEDALKSIAEEFEQLKALVSSYEVVTNYRKKLEAVHKAGLMTKESLSPEEIQLLMNLQEEANLILRAPGLKAHTGKDYIRPIMAALDERLADAGAFKEKVRVAPMDIETDTAAEEEAADLEEQLLSKKMTRGNMTIKQRKEALQKLNKEAFISEKDLAEPVLVDAEDSEEFAHQTFQQALLNLRNKLLSSI